MNPTLNSSENSSKSLPQKSEMFTTKQIAEQLTVDPKTVRENAKKCLNKAFENGKVTYFSKAEVTQLIDYMQKNNNRKDLTSTTVVQVTKTELTPALRIKQAMEMMQDAYEEELANLRTKNAEMLPKADVYDKICNSDTLKPVDQVASNLGYGKNNFFALMRGMGIFYYSSADADGKRVNLPKQEYKDRGYFVTKEEPYNRGDKDCLYTKIYVTGKGETWLAKKLGEETADAFIERGEPEYKKIMDKTASNLMDKAIKNNPPTNQTVMEIMNTYSLIYVAKLAGETVETIINYCQLQKYIDEDGNPTLYGTEITGYFTNFGSITESGKNAIVSAFAIMNKAEKGLRKTPYGKAE